MKKWYKCLLGITGLLVYICTACGMNNNKNIEMNITELTPTSAKYTIKNNSNSQISFGEAYVIQIKEEDKWKELEQEEKTWFLELIYLDSYQETSYEINWRNYYGELASGEYRLIKTISLGNKKDNLICEFVIE